MLRSHGQDGHCVPSVTQHACNGFAKLSQADCLVSSVRRHSLCSAADLTCLCKGPIELSKAVTNCVYVTCSIKEIVKGQNATAELCDWLVREKRHVTVVASTTGSLAVFAVLLRTIDALLYGRFGWHDACALVAGVWAVPLNTVQLLVGPAGFGADIWTVPFDNLVRIHVF
jgi:hypothetical protein